MSRGDFIVPNEERKQDDCVSGDAGIICRLKFFLLFQDSGIYPIKRLDTGMTFYVQLNNRGNHPVVVRSQMINCCEIITPDDVDCEVSNLKKHPLF
ncbi:hypothetical protein G9C98_000054 [Cotesia typhae]|uniref:Uncharacterized protein n=1 Tax=Cotesia typhae TaxID=2053667 RepID=A0A8J5VCI5_9HYME|nr:hypothetical protein G9C98_000054 [Cotesia typhae]